MTQPALTASKLLTRQEIKELGSSSGPAVTLFLPVHLPGSGRRKLTARIQAAVAAAEQKLTERQTVSTLVRGLLDPVAELAGGLAAEAAGETLAVFRSDEQLRHYWLPEKVEDKIVVADNFFIRPLLKTLESERSFYILALSQKDIRLLHATESSAEEVDLTGRVPRSLAEYLQTSKPDHTMDNRTSSGPASGSSKGVMFTTSTDREARDEYLLHFYKDVSRGVSDLLRGQDKTPLVACGVEYELALFERVNTWQNTCPEGVRGAPNGLTGGEMHARALECVNKQYEREIEEVLAQHNRQGGEAATAGVNEIVKAAYDGRVLHLFAADNAQAMGNFDEATHRARTHQIPRSGDEDLINAAALQTILHGGRVSVLPQSRVPGNRPLAANMRY
jgi:hypothetical protein